MLYQSVGSSSCAVCAVGNLLSLYGIERRREEIRTLFRAVVAKPLPKVDHPTLLKVVRKCFPRRSLVWRRHVPFAFGRVGYALNQAISAGGPALLTFHMRHVARDWTGVHCVVVVGVDQSGIHVIDSLGRRRGGNGPNSIISPQGSTHGWPVIGAPLIVTRRPARILLGLPSASDERLGSHEDDTQGTGHAYFAARVQEVSPTMRS